MPLTTGKPMRRSLWNIVAFCFSLMPVSCAMTDRPGATHLQHGGTLNERKSAAFPLCHISNLPVRDPPLASLPDRIDTAAGSTNRPRTNRRSGLALAEGGKRTSETRRWPAVSYSWKHKELHGY